MSTSNYRHILKYTGFFGLVQLGNTLLHVLRGKLVAVLLGASGIGLIEVFNRANDLVGALTNLGLPVSGIRHIAATGETSSQTQRHAIRLVRTWGVVAALLGMLTMLCLSPLLAIFFASDGVGVGQLMLLAPLVGLSTLSGVEWAVLKGLHRLRLVALCTLWGAIALLLAAVLCLSVWHTQGIIAMMTLSLLLLLCAQIGFNRHTPWRVHLCWRVLRPSWPWVRLGLYFNAGIALTSAAEMGIRALLLRWGGLHEVGLYTAGFVLLTAYTRLIFSSAEADFFPRLSASTTRTALSTIVNRQVEVYVALMGACLCLLVAVLPWLLPLLYTADFAPAIPMATAAALYMLCKAAATPMAYITLARGHNRLFFGLELLANATQVAAVVAGYYYYGLVGAGIGLSISHACYLGYVLLATRLRYAYRMSGRAIGLFVAQAILLIACCMAALYLPRTTLSHWLIVGTACLASGGVACGLLLHTKDKR